ncbi:S8 family serine peptidase [Arsukibacterium ikkense]|uniref:S8 family serine peptidase n=1 Tax=Arsukibacterium ikkense TaxID=336831 RepID=UPI00069CA99C|nr:S8 family serine peptidase [Arsukibacterium ikkense]
MFKSAIALMILLFCRDAVAQAAPPNRPDRPEPPARPVIERQAERQLERLERQLDAIDRHTPAAADAGLQRAQQNIARGLQQADLALAQAGSLRRKVLSRTGEPLFVEVEVEQGWRAIEREWVMLLSAEELSQLTTQFPAVLNYLAEQQSLPTLNLTLLRLVLPEQLNSYQALQQLLPEALALTVDRNHLYQPQAQLAAAAQGGRAMPAMAGSCTYPTRVGVIDSAVDVTHPVFAQLATPVVTKHFINEQLPFSAAHGTAVVSRLLGLPQAAVASASDSMVILAAAAFYQAEQHDAGALIAILQALEWLAANDVQIINMSLTGPANRVLARGVTQTQAAGISLVAAAGNAGPAAEPLYPAAYPAVVAVTAVDNDNQIYRWANRGDYIDFAALGVKVDVAQPANSYASLSGTSMAAPVVTKLLACELAKAAGNLSQALTVLQQSALDLGNPGKDPVFGYGLLKVQP